MTSPAVEESSPSVPFLPSTTGCRPVASSLPSSTPHWSKALMFQHYEQMFRGIGEDEFSQFVATLQKVLRNIRLSEAEG